MDELSDKLSVVSICISVFTFIFCIPFVKGLRGYFIPLMLLVTAACIADCLNLFFTANEMVNLIVLRGYTFVEFTLLICFYYSFFRRHFRSYPLFFVTLPLFYLVCLLDYKVNGAGSFDNLSLSVEAILLSICALCSFWVLLAAQMDLLRLPFFYVNCGVLLYFLGNLLFFVFSNLVFDSPPLWDLHSVLSIFFDILIVIAFWRSRAV